MRLSSFSTNDARGSKVSGMRMRAGMALLCLYRSLAQVIDLPFFDDGVCRTAENVEG